MSETTDQKIQQAIAAAKAGDMVAARHALSQVVRQEPDNARAWYLLCQVVKEQEQVVYCLEKVLELQPNNAQAKKRLQHIRSPHKEQDIGVQPPAVREH